MDPWEQLRRDIASRRGYCRCGLCLDDPYFFNDGRTVRVVCKGCAISSKDAGRHIIQDRT